MLDSPLSRRLNTNNPNFDAKDNRFPLLGNSRFGGDEFFRRVSPTPPNTTTFIDHSQNSPIGRGENNSSPNSHSQQQQQQTRNNTTPPKGTSHPLTDNNNNNIRTESPKTYKTQTTIYPEPVQSSSNNNFGPGGIPIRVEHLSNQQQYPTSSHNRSDFKCKFFFVVVFLFSYFKYNF